MRMLSETFTSFIFSINFVVLVLFLYELLKTIKNYYKLKKYGGEKVDSFKHNSELKVLFSTLLALTILLSFFAIKYDAFFSHKILDYIMLYILLIVEIINISASIVVYENGIYYNGKFTKWNEISLVKKYNKDSIRIEMKNSWLAIILMNRVKRKSELIELIDKGIEGYNREHLIE